MNRATVEIGVGPVAPEQVVAVAREDAAVELLAEAPVPACGVCTGFGAFGQRNKSPQSCERNSRSHWCARTPPAASARSNGRWFG